MRSVNSLDELNLPGKHKTYLLHLLGYIVKYPVVKKVILFGSCASGIATIHSDIDIMLLGDSITDDDEWNIAWNCPKWDEIEGVPTDILSDTFEEFEEMAKVPGMLQSAIQAKGVDLSGLLRFS